jgi:hypothetical protein
MCVLFAGVYASSSNQIQFFDSKSIFDRGDKFQDIYALVLSNSFLLKFSSNVLVGPLFELSYNASSSCPTGYYIDENTNQCIAGTNALALHTVVGRDGSNLSSHYMIKIELTYFSFSFYCRLAPRNSDVCA